MKISQRPESRQPEQTLDQFVGIAGLVQGGEDAAGQGARIIGQGRFHLAAACLVPDLLAEAQLVFQCHHGLGATQQRVVPVEVQLAGMAEIEICGLSVEVLAHLIPGEPGQPQHRLGVRRASCSITMAEKTQPPGDDLRKGGEVEL